MTSKEKQRIPFPDRFWLAMKDATSRLLMIDYDGTIAPFRVNRALAYPYPGIIELLRKILKLDGNQIAIVSGRPLSELKNFIGIPGVRLFGSYGMEEEKDGSQKNRPLSTVEKNLLLQGRQNLEKAGMGTHIEVKPFGIAFHVRGMGNGVSLINEVKMRWEPLLKTGLIVMRDSDCTIELTPTWEKDLVVRKLIGEAPFDTFAVYIGDDVPDEPAFKAVNTCGWGIKLGKRKHPSAAKLYLRGFEDLLDFLKQWVSVLA